MTYPEVVSKLSLQAVCFGGCGLSPRAHRGTLFLGVIHFADRRFTKRGLRRLLLLAARRSRLAGTAADPSAPVRGFLGDPKFVSYHLWWDEQYANLGASMLGIRFPVAYSAPERRACALMAPRGLSRSHPAIWAWARRGETA